MWSAGDEAPRNASAVMTYEGKKKVQEKEAEERKRAALQEKAA